MEKSQCTKPGTGYAVVAGAIGKRGYAGGAVGAAWGLLAFIERSLVMNAYLVKIAALVLCVISLAIAHADNLKKGIGLAESEGLGEDQLKALRVGWYYNWGPKSAIKTQLPFVPMAFRISGIEKLPHNSPIVLGFNEPDNEKQSNVSVSQALCAWPALQGRTQLAGAPAMAKNPIKKDSWLMEFMAGSPKVDFMTLHWYKGADARKFIADVETLCETYRKPVWVTEFAPQTAGDARAKPERYSQAEVEAFIQETTQWMEKSDCVHRYAWHDAKVGTSALFDGRELSATGRAYAQASN
ncbi:MAG: glycosyl hydrolase [Rhodoferax sp.]|nr:glycosyl hydrolase [Rhodoferax sp.]